MTDLPDPEEIAELRNEILKLRSELDDLRSFVKTMYSMIDDAEYNTPAGPMPSLDFGSLNT